MANKSLSSLHDPHNSSHQSYGGKTSQSMPRNFNTLETLLDFYFGHPSATFKNDVEYHTPHSKW